MTDVVLKSSDRFPVGTSVAAYPASNWLAAQKPPSGSPAGSAAETKTVAADGTLTFTTLSDSTEYYAYASVGGQDRYVHFFGYRPAQYGTPGDAPGGAAGGDLAGTYPNPSIKTALNDPAAGTPGMRTLGTGAQQALPGNTSVGGPDASTTVKGISKLATAPASASNPIAVGDNDPRVITGPAPLASPTFTGTPAAPTAAVDTATTQLATTAFVVAQASAAGDGTPAMAGTAARGASTHYARADHVHPTDTAVVPLAPATAAASTIQPSADVVALTIKGKASQTADLFNTLDSAGSLKSKVKITGDSIFGMNAAGAATANKGLQVGDVAALASADYYGIAHSDRANSTDYALIQSSAGGTILNCASGQNLLLRTANTTRVLVSSTGTQINGKFGCNSVAPATQSADTAAQSTTAATLTTPYGFTTQAQADAIATHLNDIRTCLRNHGLMA